ncbi:class I glutamine amidotransferase-like protein [Zalerion maritima]|uniref:Class I glutamine amidotransferase-like protein n=1 Tax=Zalerion maritima TaxID=339359 RepID=A0AAD5RHZ5_9PEZI|nr:class I glutamine amidotransferase-like protein [Zalerion maritima]
MSLVHPTNLKPNFGSPSALRTHTGAASIKVRNAAGASHHHGLEPKDSSPSLPRVAPTSGTPEEASTTAACGARELPPLGSLRIAILLNSYNSPYIAALKSSYEKCLLAISPSSSLSFYYPAHDMHALPNPALFDLIVVGGSNVDPQKAHPWVLKVHQYIRDIARDWPQKKMVGICWGHQTMALVFGGKVRDMDVPELGITTNALTPRGNTFFRFTASNNGKMRVQQHHRREVSHPAPGFIPLLDGRQAFINANNTILTFQGHPEKDAETALLRLNDATRWYGMDVTNPEVRDRLRRRMEGDHDGDFVWRRILEWVGEEGVGVADGVA